MNLRKLIFTQNACYKEDKTIIVKGIMVHSTGANNPILKRYVNPDDGLLGKNLNNNHWNQDTPDGRKVCVHGFIGKLNDGSVATYQTLPWNYRGWHGGSGVKGSVNDTHIGFEICEDSLTDRIYFDAVYKEAVELCAYLCKEYKLDPMGDGVIIGHYEGYMRGVASNHSDPNNWFPKFEKSMDMFRANVKALMNVDTTTKLTNQVTLTADKTLNDETIWAFLTSKGLNAYAVSGLMGNLYAESGLKPNNLQNSYEKSLCFTDDSYTSSVDKCSYNNFVKDCAGYGLAQWTYHTRKQALLDFAKATGASVCDLMMQLNFLWKELQEYTGVISVLKCATSVRQASDVVLLQYERPADQSITVQIKRAEYGQSYYSRFVGKPVTGIIHKVGDIVQFTGGAVYPSSNEPIPTHSHGKSKCKVTQSYNGKHPYHLISEDGAGVFGWVDIIDISPISSMIAESSNSTVKSIDEIAKEVINGNWSNGQERKDKLTAAGYDVNAVQQRVNALMK